jgi:hypothetical protein
MSTVLGSCSLDRMSLCSLATYKDDQYILYETSVYSEM